MSRTRSRMASIQADLISLSATVKNMLARANDPQSKFFDHTVNCHTCRGTGWAPVYNNGLRSVIRCPGWVFTKDEKNPDNSKSSKCEGNPHWKEWEEQNKRDICSKIWETLILADADETKFIAWLKEKFEMDRLDQLHIEQLEVVLVKVKAKLYKKYEAEIKKSSKAA